MGVGRPEDLVEGVARGVDMFDCVMPTRNARNGHYFTSFGTVRIRNSQYARDMDPIEPGCGCVACTGGYTRSYLRHLDRCNEMLAPMLGTLHNLFYYEKLMADIRAAYIPLPSEIRGAFVPRPVLQRYGRTAERSWRYHQPDAGFTADLVVDDLGLVLHYPQLFRSLAPA